MKMDFHPLVLATRRELEKQTPDGYHLLGTYQPGTLNVRVSASHMARALQLLQSVVTGAINRKWIVEPKTADHKAGIRIGKERIAFFVTEESKRVKPTWAEKTAGTRRYEATGRLKLAFECWCDPSVDQKSWADGRTQRIEEFITDFLDNVGTGAERRRLNEEKWERQRRKRQRLAIRIQEEKGRREEVFEEASRWRQMTDLRAMIEQLRQEIASDSPRWPADRAQRWIEWAEALVNRKDPFLNGYFDRILKVKRFYPELDVTKEPSWY